MAIIPRVWKSVPVNNESEKIINTPVNPVITPKKSMIENLSSFKNKKDKIETFIGKTAKIIDVISEYINCSPQ